MSFLVFALAVALSDAAPAAQPASETPAATAPAAPAPKAPEMVCKREAVTGTRFTKKICMTKDEADQQRQHDRQMLEKIQGGMRGIPSG